LANAVVTNVILAVAVFEAGLLGRAAPARLAAPAVRVSLFGVLDSVHAGRRYTKLSVPAHSALAVFSDVVAHQAVVAGHAGAAAVQVRLAHVPVDRVVDTVGRHAYQLAAQPALAVVALFAVVAHLAVVTTGGAAVDIGFRPVLAFVVAAGLLTLVVVAHLAIAVIVLVAGAIWGAAGADGTAAVPAGLFAILLLVVAGGLLANVAVTHPAHALGVHPAGGTIAGIESAAAIHVGYTRVLCGVVTQLLDAHTADAAHVSAHVVALALGARAGGAVPATVDVLFQTVEPVVATSRKALRFENVLGKRAGKTAKPGQGQQASEAPLRPGGRVLGTIHHRLRSLALCRTDDRCFPGWMPRERSLCVVL
jgi:hypothetical protein